MPLCSLGLPMTLGCKLSGVILPIQGNSCPLGQLCSSRIRLLFINISSLDGDVKLWDLRHTNQAANAWTPQPNGLAAFDVHPTTRVFAS